MLAKFWQLFYAIGSIFTVVNGQILNKYFSHLVTLISTHLNYIDKHERMNERMHERKNEQREDLLFIVLFGTDGQRP